MGSDKTFISYKMYFLLLQASKISISEIQWSRVTPHFLCFSFLHFQENARNVLKVIQTEIVLVKIVFNDLFFELHKMCLQFEQICVRSVFGPCPIHQVCFHFLRCVSTPLQLRQSGLFCSRYARLLSLLDVGARHINQADFSTEQTTASWHLVNFQSKTLQTERQIQGLLLILPLGTQTFCLFVVDSVITVGTQLISDICISVPCLYLWRNDWNTNWWSLEMWKVVPSKLKWFILWREGFKISLSPFCWRYLT